MTLTEEQIAGLMSDMARRIESHDLFDVPDGAKYHTATHFRPLPPVPEGK